MDVSPQPLHQLEENCAERGRLMSEIVEGVLGERINTYLSRIAPFGFSGAVLVADRGTIVLNRGYGLADRAGRIPNTRDTILSLGSITKQFTAAAIMKLEMQGHLRTSDPITEFFADVPGNKEGVTLHHVLTHTAGLLNYTGEDYEMAGRDETVVQILQSLLRFPPGSDFAYSNAGYTLLAAVIEQVTGRSYEEHLRDELFIPAGMHSTGYRLPDWSAMNVAHWYSVQGDFGTPLDKPYPSWHLMGNGDMLSSTGDMHRWHVALSGDRILSEAAKARMYTPDLRDYAYGWEVVETARGRCLQHSGASSHGSSALFKRWPNDDLVLVVLCNTDHDGEVLVSKIEAHLESILASGEVAMPPTIPTQPPPLLEMPEGEFVLPGGGKITATTDSGAVRLVPSNQEAIDWLLMPDEPQAMDAARTVEKTQAIMDAALVGDTGPLADSLANREAREAGVVRTWQALVAEVNPIAVTVLGARPSHYIDESLDVFTRCEGREKVGYFVSIWREGQNVGVLPADIRTGCGLGLDARPVTPTSLVAYRLSDARTSEFEVVVESATPVGLISQRGIEAKRLPPSE